MQNYYRWLIENNITAKQLFDTHCRLQRDGHVEMTSGEGETANLTVVKYTREYPTLNFSNEWDPYVAWARGIVYDTSNVDAPRIVGLGFEKFWNYMETPQRIPDPSSHIVDISEKADGSYGCCFFWKGNWRITSSGAVNSPQALKGTQMLRSMPWLNKLNTAYCYIVEVIYPENQIILSYGDREDLILLGARKLEPVIGPMLTPQQAYNLIGDDSVSVVENFNHVELSSGEVFQFINEKQSDKLVEGVIVTYSDNTRFKFKADQYVKLHALKRSITFNSAFQAMREGLYDNYLNDVPEEFRPIVDGWHAEVQDKISRLLEWADVWWQYVKSNGHSTLGKDLALFLTANVTGPARKYVFNFANGKDNLQTAYNDYKNFKDIILWQPPSSQQSL